LKNNEGTSRINGRLEAANWKAITMDTQRRQFLSESFTTVSAFALSGAFSALSGRLAHGGTLTAASQRKLVEVRDEATGLPLLKLPEGFRYRSFGWTKDRMDDGHPTPDMHDGMAVVAEENGIVTLVRNHEIGSYGKSLKGKAKAYDSSAGGGCTSLQFNTGSGEWLKSWTSLSGTVRNCAGGPTPWGSWLSCEETVVDGKTKSAGKDDKKEDKTSLLKQTHGWVFDVPASGTATPIPLKGLGRFVHEAIAIDAATGIVYETEDRGQAGFYRFIPAVPGQLAKGGKLQMARVVGQDDLRAGVAAGSRFAVEWVDIADPERPHTPGTDDAAGVFGQGKQLGGTTFARLEGCWFGNGKVYFDATSGGAAQCGQIWSYDPNSQTLELLFESPGVETLNMPDNLCVHPQGGLLLCEDSDYGKFSMQRIHLLNQAGQLSLFAVNNIDLNGEKNGFKGDYRGKEWAGATFSPDGRWLFVNIQTPGITFAITGPWADVL